MNHSPESHRRPASGGVRKARLRSACNQCCAAKVKCSGERSGCERCRNAGAQCVYMESRVGKVPGVRAKRKPAHNDGIVVQSRPDGPASQSVALAAQSTGSPQQSTDSTNTSVHSALESVTFSEQEDSGTMAWTDDWQLEPMDNISLEFAGDASDLCVVGQSHNQAATNSSSCIQMIPDSEELFAPTMGEAMEGLLDFPAHRSSSAEQPPEPTSNRPIPTGLGLRPRNEIDSQCCVECCHIIYDVENYIMADLKAFKILLGIIRSTLEKLTRLIKLQESSRNLRCLMLFTTIMYQILELLEACLSAVEREKSTYMNGKLTGGIPGFGLGETSFDSEEQFAFRTHTIMREIDHATEVLAKLKTLVSIGPDAGTANSRESEQGKSRGDCSVDLELRFRNLKLKLARKT